MLDHVVALIDQRLALLVARLEHLQNADGGFKGFYTHDSSSGVWSTAEILHNVAKCLGTDDKGWLNQGAAFLAGAQNADGGWPFRHPGKSIVDVTAWSCLALSHYGYREQVRGGVEYLLKAKANTGAPMEDAWGLTSYERDRVYSTWAGVYCIARLLRTRVASELALDESALSETITGAAEWLKRSRCPDGAWGPMPGAPSSVTSTAVALHTLFILGSDPREFTSAADFLLSRIVDDYWEPEDEIVVTQEGYELTQEWFTSAIAFRSLIFFAEFQLVPIERMDRLFYRLLDLIETDGSVRLAPAGHGERIWTIPFMIDALAKYRRFVVGNRSDYNAFLDRKRASEQEKRRRHVEDQLTVGFPYPISNTYFHYKHELDHHRRFHSLIHNYEVSIKYCAIVCLSGYLAAKDRNREIDALVVERFERPTLGDWCQLLNLLLRDSSGAAELIDPSRIESVLGARPVADGAGGRENLVQVMERILELRNQNSGHGAMRSLFEYKLIVDEEEPRLYRFYERLKFLADGNSFLVLSSHYDEFGEGDRYRIRVFKGVSIQDSELETSSRLAEGQQESMVRYVYFQNLTNGTIVNLYPFVSYMFCDDCKREQFFFFNGRRSEVDIQYLSYGCGHVVSRTNGRHLAKRVSGCSQAR